MAGKLRITIQMDTSVHEFGSDIYKRKRNMASRLSDNLTLYLYQESDDGGPVFALRDCKFGLDIQDTEARALAAWLIDHGYGPAVKEQ